MVCIFGNEFLMIADHVGLVEESFFFYFFKSLFLFKELSGKAGNTSERWLIFVLRFFGTLSWVLM